jgi:hypothetical protein
VREGKALTGDAGMRGGGYFFKQENEKLTSFGIREYPAMRGGFEKMRRDEILDYAARKMTAL